MYRVKWTLIHFGTPFVFFRSCLDGPKKKKKKKEEEHGSLFFYPLRRCPPLLCIFSSHSWGSLKIHSFLPSLALLSFSLFFSFRYSLYSGKFHSDIAHKYNTVQGDLPLTRIPPPPLQSQTFCPHRSFRFFFQISSFKLGKFFFFFFLWKINVSFGAEDLTWHISRGIFQALKTKEG